MSNTKSLEFFRRSTPSYEAVFTKDDVPIDITGWKIYLTIKESQEDTDANAKLNKSISTHTDATNGKSLITLTSTETDIVVGNYYYSFDFLDDEGNEGVLLSGRLKVKKPLRDARA